MSVDLSRLHLTILHQYVVGNDGQHEQYGDNGPDKKENVDDGGEKACRDAAAEARSKARVDLRSSGARSQKANREQNERQAAHYRRYYDYYGLHNANPFHFGLDLKR